MQECRNWQTSKTKDLVSNALVWVQVPSPAFNTNGVDEMSTPFCVRSRACLEPKFKVYAPLRSAQSRRPLDVLRPISCIRKRTRVTEVIWVFSFGFYRQYLGLFTTIYGAHIFSTYIHRRNYVAIFKITVYRKGNTIYTVETRMFGFVYSKNYCVFICFFNPHRKTLSTLCLVTV